MHPALSQFLAQFPTLSEEEQALIGQQLSVHNYRKGDILHTEGEVSTMCYFVLKGCIRQYCTVDNGDTSIEKTVEFFTEGQAVVLFSSYGHQLPSKYSFMCAEDSTLIVGDMAQEHSMYEQFPKLLAITRSMMEEYFGKIQEEFARFITSTPEERYQYVLHNRPDLFQRVPQHQIASYLGITPESLSRIRRRMMNNVRV
jgi:CRP-like cAMP-binding protein